MSTNTTPRRGLTIGRLMIVIGLLAVFLAPVVWSIRQVRSQRLQALLAMERAERARLEAIRAETALQNAHRAGLAPGRDATSDSDEVGPSAAVEAGSEGGDAHVIERLRRDNEELRRENEQLRAEMEALRGSAGQGSKVVED